jgi:hypothetical protein
LQELVKSKTSHRVFEWANSGYPVFRDGEAVREVHPFDAEWGRLLDPELRTPER